VHASVWRLRIEDQREVEHAAGLRACLAAQTQRTSIAGTSSCKRLVETVGVSFFCWLATYGFASKALRIFQFHCGCFLVMAFLELPVGYGGRRYELAAGASPNCVRRIFGCG